MIYAKLVENVRLRSQRTGGCLRENRWRRTVAPIDRDNKRAFAQRIAECSQGNSNRRLPEGGVVARTSDRNPRRSLHLHRADIQGTLAKARQPPLLRLDAAQQRRRP